MMPIKIYHIVHVNRLISILDDEGLLSDAVISQRVNNGSMIGLSNIKQRRLHELTLNSYPDLHVGDCVPFYFCPRSVMLYLIHRRHPELAYQGGKNPLFIYRLILIRSLHGRIFKIHLFVGLLLVQMQVLIILKILIT